MVYVLGKNSKAIIDMKVQPCNEDIRRFVGPGKVHEVFNSGSQVAVLHDDGNLRSYDIGHDMNFELELVEGQEPALFEGEDEHLNVAQNIRPERLMKIVCAYADKDPRGANMGRSQAFFLLEKTVRHYFKEHREDVDWVSMRQKVSKVEFRLSKIKGMIKDMSAGNHDFMTSSDEMKVLQQFLKEFYDAVYLDRQKTLSDIRAKEIEVRALRKKLLIVETQVLSENFGEYDRRTRQGLPPAEQPDRKQSAKFAESLVRASVASIWPSRGMTNEATERFGSVMSHWPVWRPHNDTEDNEDDADERTSTDMPRLKEFSEEEALGRQDTYDSGKRVDLGQIDVEFFEGSDASKDTLDQVSSVGEFEGDEYELAAIDNRLGITSAVATSESVLRTGRTTNDIMSKRSVDMFNALSSLHNMQRELSGGSSFSDELREDSSDEDDIDALNSSVSGDDAASENNTVSEV
jgi:hypothetical protein